MQLRNSFQEEALINYVFLTGKEPASGDSSGFLGLLTTPAAVSAAQSRRHRLSDKTSHQTFQIALQRHCHPTLGKKAQQKKKKKTEARRVLPAGTVCTEPQSHGGSRCGAGPWCRGITQGRRQQKYLQCLPDQAPFSHTRRIRGRGKKEAWWQTGTFRKHYAAVSASCTAAKPFRN